MTTRPAALTRVHWYRPEWPVAVVAATGWVALVVVVPADPTRLLRGPAQHGPVALLVHAAVMSAAMMAPLVLPSAHELAVSSLWRRRYRSVALYLAGYLGVWVFVGIAMMLAARRLTLLVDDVPVVAGTAGLAVLVARSRNHLRRLRRCGATHPLALFGRRADRDCLDAGVRLGGRCVLTSWALMLAVMAQGGIAVVAAGTVVMVLERRGLLRPARAVVWTAAVAAFALSITAWDLPAGSVPGPPLDPHRGH